jgi:hypothetical protein
MYMFKCLGRAIAICFLFDVLYIYYILMSALVEDGGFGTECKSCIQQSVFIDLMGQRFLNMYQALF